MSGNTEAARAVFQGALLAHPDNEVLAATLSRLNITDLGSPAPSPAAK